MNEQFYWERARGASRRIEIKDRTHIHTDQVIAEVWDVDLAERIVKDLNNDPKSYITERHGG